ncbi:FAD-dependent oxidoreductase [Desulfotomaculum sp. 1211_IL3151]|uniref:FAD-dependent oxidoreductase n=1 Tax=Desulfotomaculum sp. 1211_IL3151 TaxID=3084055 RepID=UPI002FD9C166
MRKGIVGLLIILLGVLGYGFFSYGQPQRQDVVILGGGFDGCAAARSAAAAAPDRKILLVVSEPVQELGSIGTVGGQNFTDIRLWKGQLVTQGSFGRWYSKAGQFYNNQRMAQIIQEDLSQFPNITILYGYDLFDLKLKGDEIREITLKPISRNDQGVVDWGDQEKKIAGQVFIDASVDGRLTRLSDNQLSVGRGDWPEEYLPPDERGTATRQQAATLMFQVKGVKPPAKPTRIQDWEFVRDKQGSWGLAGGKQAFSNDPEVISFNEKYGSQGFAIKPINAAMNGKDSDVWWVNCLLVFDVEAQAQARDRETENYPKDTPVRHLNTDQAWSKARGFLKEADFIQVLRQFKVQDPATGQWYGFGDAEIVLDKDHQPVVGQVMYIRESVHSPISNKPSLGTENTNFAISTKEAQGAGTYGNGLDQGNYQHRVGLGYYMMDINAFVAEDLKASGVYDWPVTKHLRPDWRASGGEPINPVYLPFEALLPEKTNNLLVPGYASSISSFAWAELRVLPNLAVLGDAAGVAAVRSLSAKKYPREFSQEDIAWVQKKLTQFGARLDK